MLISVTNFFRDREAFEALERTLIPRSSRASRPATRCASGWPAARRAKRPTRSRCCCAEYAHAADARARVQMFATDIDEDAIAVARAGLYPEAIVDRRAAGAAAPFFEQEARRLPCAARLRELVMFAPHNVLRTRRSRSSISFVPQPADLPRTARCRRSVLEIVPLRAAARRLSVSRHVGVGRRAARPVHHRRQAVPHLPAKRCSEAAARRCCSPTVASDADAQRGAAADVARDRARRTAELHQRLLEQLRAAERVVDDSARNRAPDRQRRPFLQLTGGEPRSDLLSACSRSCGSTSAPRSTTALQTASASSCAASRFARPTRHFVIDITRAAGARRAERRRTFAW